MGYNVQAAVDTKHHLVVAHEVTNIGNDRGQLASMADQAAHPAMGKSKLEAIADRGYFSGPQIKMCEGDWHHGVRAEADDVQQQGRGSLQ